MKVIFLDIDGVIAIDKTNYNLSIDLMKKVKRICDETGAKIVITSSRRLGNNNLEELINTLTNDKQFSSIPFLMPELIIGMTPIVTPGNKKEYKYVLRGKELNYYLGSNSEVTRYVILDDESDYYPFQRNFLIKTSNENGISDDDVEKAIEILNRSPEEYLKSIAIDSCCLDSFTAIELDDALNALRELREKYSWKSPKNGYPKDKFVLCRMKSNGAIVGGFIYEDNGKFKVSTLPDFEFEDYGEYECEAWTYEYEE